MQLIRAVAAYYLPPGGHRGNTIHVSSYLVNDSPACRYGVKGVPIGNRELTKWAEDMGGEKDKTEVLIRKGI